MEATTAPVGRADYESLRIEVEQLRHALESRVIIEQAKGILAERLAVSMDEAFNILRYAARAHHVKLHDLAGRVVRERATPAPVVFSIGRTQRARAAWMREIAEAHRTRAEELCAALDEQSRRIERRSAARPARGSGST